MTARPLAGVDLGRRGYAEVEVLQNETRAAVISGLPGAERVFVVEHDPVITQGRSARREHVLASDSELARRGIAIADSRRGGGVTVHGPGQAVIYPVVRLERGIVAHVEALAQAAVDVAAACGVSARWRRDRPGVWVGEAKLASVGLHVHRRVVTHGIAVNVTSVPSGFDHVVPCGMTGCRMTSLAEAGGLRSGPTDEVVSEFGRRVAAAFAAALGRTLSWERA